MLLQNVSPLGDVTVAGYGLIEAGRKFAVNADDVEGLIGQAENFAPADEEARAALAAFLAPEPEPVEDETPPADLAGDSADTAPPTENEAA